MPWKPSHPGEYPTLGYYVLDWWAEYLLSPDRPGQDDPFVATREQAELVLRFYRLDPVTGKRVVRRGSCVGRVDGVSHLWWQVSVWWRRWVMLFSMGGMRRVVRWAGRGGRCGLRTSM